MLSRLRVILSEHSGFQYFPSGLPLIEPQRQDINEQLWSQNWDILFFADRSQTEKDSGQIYINQTDSLTIEELKYALRIVGWVEAKAKPNNVAKMLAFVPQPNLHLNSSKSLKIRVKLDDDNL
ncbi:hypothetical protein F7734_08200 [Scytonema sp. UIC 10036]|uniref:hypothetical protein n=1 Tax=Scytonema sp. UIC 10036 TaxID=2304196 RepID=UPI0012DAB72F|nr:hypothetical protein [Scytonema sp. UIC 10036]MUG92439.1 hypothetical protein [Scytonema sp. UIC 10036]